MSYLPDLSSLEPSCSFDRGEQQSDTINVLVENETLTLPQDLTTDVGLKYFRHIARTKIDTGFLYYFYLRYFLMLFPVQLLIV